MSLVILVLGSALNSLQFQALTGLGPTLRVNFQFAVSTRGVGPAVRTGKCSTRCWPGGTRSVWRSEEHTSELQSLMRISYAVFCLKKKQHIPHTMRDGPRANNRHTYTTLYTSQPVILSIY